MADCHLNTEYLDKNSWGISEVWGGGVYRQRCLKKTVENMRLPCEQWRPVKPSGQVQVYDDVSEELIQVPLFRHGLDWQASTLDSQYSPVHSTCIAPIHYVPYKRHPFYFCDIFVRCHPILLIFGRNIPEVICNKHIGQPPHLSVVRDNMNSRLFKVEACLTYWRYIS